jgi:2-isopropylmalate synthase
MAVANSLAGVVNGARQVECTINGLGERAGNASLEEIVMNLKTRHDYYNLETGINTQEIYATSRLVSQITGMRVQRNKAIVGANAFAHEAGIHQDGILKDASTYEIMTPESVGWRGENLVLGKHSGRHAFSDRLDKLGFTEIPKEQRQQLFERFIELCDKKRDVYDEDIIAIVEEELFKDRSDNRWILDKVQILSGTDTLPTASVVMKRGESGESKVMSAVGDGPVDAVFRAIAKLTDIKTSLLAYNIESITRGKDAQGQAVLRVERDGKRAQGKCADTDILVASAEAYVDALNHLEFIEAAAKENVRVISREP